MEKEGSVILERIKEFMKGDQVALSDYIDEKLILFLGESSQEEALNSLIELLDKEEKLRDKQDFYTAIVDREKIVSTGIGIGVAIPHAKSAVYEDFFVAIGIQKDEGIDWNSLDSLPVRLIFMIGGPEDKQTEYLNILSMITGAIKDEERRKRLLKAENAQEIVAIFEDL